MTKELEERLALLEKELAKSKPAKRIHAVSRKRAMPIILLAICIITAMCSFMVWHNWKLNSTGLSPAITKKAAFSVYFYGQAPPSDFKLDADSIELANGVLLFRMVHSKNGKAIVYTEQPVNTFDVSSLEGDEEFKTTYGQAYITDGQTRTTGALFTNDKTWVLINAPDPIGADSMRDLLNSLEPVARPRD